MWKPIGSCNLSSMILLVMSHEAVPPLTRNLKAVQLGLTSNCDLFSSASGAFELSMPANLKDSILRHAYHIS